MKKRSMEKIHPVAAKVNPSKKDDLSEELQRFHSRIKSKYQKGTGDSVKILGKVRRTFSR